MFEKRDRPKTSPFTPAELEVIAWMSKRTQGVVVQYGVGNDQIGTPSEPGQNELGSNPGEPHSQETEPITALGMD